ncbi:hypothetical protein IWW36_002640 [Coemansia brasiliensis]|uniref:Uncharacterized protein n=1 Tax=Coemansia brasiliensis TaxID=2650707 RepID=A0A9W8IED0_9FUNG|nr:hypothetical protein IWW36_002640 [Coemansia brasiliensis]
MLPENVPVAIEPVRACRLLRKLLDKIAELEETTASSDQTTIVGLQLPSNNYNRTYSRPTTPRRKAVGRTIPPPAHPFKHLLVKQSTRQPRYTYKRRRCPASGSDSDSPPTLRSPSLDSLSDSETSMDPALWLTTPRKRQRRGSASSTRSLDSDGSMETRSRSFTSRLETLVLPTSSSATSRFKSMHLLSQLVSLGETLWLGGLSEDPARRMRLLPLKVISAFRLGEAIACSDGSDDLEYANEMYCSLPPFLVRFVLWQHAVSLCYLRIPAYFDTLSEALWQVGAFFQQQRIIEWRLADLACQDKLLDPTYIAPLHLRAVDIGTESLLIQTMLDKIDSHGASDSNMLSPLLWIQFIPTKALNPSHAASESVDSNHPKNPPSRYAKWVARISNVAESTRILSKALKQALSTAESSFANSSRYVCTKASTTPTASLEMDLMEAIQTENVVGKEPIFNMAKLLMRWIYEKSLDSIKNTVQASNRISLVARFNTMSEEASGIDDQGVFECIVLPLATVGASPIILYEIADIVANDLSQHKIAQFIIELALRQFSNIWNRYCECKIWHQEWSQLQNMTMPGNPNHEDRQSIYFQLKQKLEQLKPTTKQHSAKLQVSSIPKDELGLLLPRRRIRRIKHTK